MYGTQLGHRSGVRALAAADLPAARSVVDSTGLFPGELLDGMTQPYLSGAEGGIWLVHGHGGVQAVTWCIPERMTQGTWNMLLLAVHAGHQRSGLGRELVCEAESRVRDAGGRLLLVETSGLPEFERTRAFYRACGYEPEARIRDFYREGEDKVVFRRTLTD